MPSVLAIVLGLGVILIIHPGPVLMIVLGLVAGCVIMIAEVVSPRPQPAYIPPTSRPRPITLKRQIAAAAFFAGLGLFGIAVSLFVRMPLASGPPVIGYGGGMLVGMAVGQLLTLTKAREAHNSRLTRMTPRSPLGF